MFIPHARTILALLMSFASPSLAAAPGNRPDVHIIKLKTNEASIQIPKHELITINEKPDWVFFSVKPGEGANASSSIVAEVSLTLSEGTIDQATDRIRKTSHVGDGLEIVREIKRDGLLIWLVKDKEDNGKGSVHNLRAFQFVQGKEAVLVIDTTGRSSRDMAPAAKRRVNDIFLGSLKSVKLGGKGVPTSEIQQYVGLR